MMNKLYIGNLSPAVTADDLRQLFGDRKLPLAGQVLLKSGYAFVDYPDQNWAIRAIETLSGEHSDDPRRASPARDGGSREAEPPGPRPPRLPRPHAPFHAPAPRLGRRAGSGTAGCPAPTAGANLDPGASDPGPPCAPPRVPRLAGSLGAPLACPAAPRSFPRPHLCRLPCFPFLGPFQCPLCQGPPKSSISFPPGQTFLLPMPRAKDLSPSAVSRAAFSFLRPPLSPGPPLSAAPRLYLLNPSRSPGSPHPAPAGPHISLGLFPKLTSLSLVSEALLFFPEFFVRFY